MASSATSSSSTHAARPYEQCFVCNGETLCKFVCAACHVKYMICRSCANDHRCWSCNHVVQEIEVTTDSDVRSGIHSDPTTGVLVSVPEGFTLTACGTPPSVSTVRAIELEGRLAEIELELYRLRGTNSSTERGDVEQISSEQQQRTKEDIIAENRHLKWLVAQQQDRIRELEKEVHVMKSSTAAPQSRLTAGLSLTQHSEACMIGTHFLKISGSDPPMLLAQVSLDEVPLICVHCDDPVRGLFTHSWNLVGAILCCEVDEQPSESSSLYNVFSEAGPPWRGEHVMHITAIGGKYPGLMALGVGSARKKLERAARLALAISGYCFDIQGDSGIHDPTSDGTFAYLVRLAKQAQDKFRNLQH